jgi:hypothetical protein
MAVLGRGNRSRSLAGFHGPLSNVDVSSDGNIDHLNIDKSARLHTRVLAAILEVVGNGSGNQRLVSHPQRTTATLSARSPRRNRGRTGLPNRWMRRGRQSNPAIASPIQQNPYRNMEYRVSNRIAPTIAVDHSRHQAHNDGSIARRFLADGERPVR